MEWNEVLLQRLPFDAVRALTQHKTSGVIGVYARHAFEEEKRLVAETIEGEIRAIIQEGMA